MIAVNEVKSSLLLTASDGCTQLTTPLVQQKTKNSKI